MLGFPAGAATTPISCGAQATGISGCGWQTILTADRLLKKLVIVKFCSDRQNGAHWGEIQLHASCHTWHRRSLSVLHAQTLISLVQFLQSEFSVLHSFAESFSNSRASACRVYTSCNLLCCSYPAGSLDRLVSTVVQYSISPRTPSAASTALQAAHCTGGSDA